VEYSDVYCVCVCVCGGGVFGNVLYCTLRILCFLVNRLESIRQLVGLQADTHTDTLLPEGFCINDVTQNKKQSGNNFRILRRAVCLNYYSNTVGPHKVPWLS